MQDILILLEINISMLVLECFIKFQSNISNKYYRIWTPYIVASKTVTTCLSKQKAIIYKIYWIELSYMIVYLGVMVEKGCIKFQYNTLSSYSDMVS